VLPFRFLAFFYRHPSLRSTRPSFLKLIPITSLTLDRSAPLIPFGVLHTLYNNTVTLQCTPTLSLLDTNIATYLLDVRTSFER
jgi:hypothetical protein